MVGGIRTAPLLIMHAVKGTRPDWVDEMPMPGSVPAVKGPNAMIVGECRGKNLYSIGSYCPLKWSPSPVSIITSRAEYAAWHDGLCRLARTLQLEKFTVLPPKASATPWLDAPEIDDGRIITPVRTARNDVRRWGTLPLAPQRDRMGAPYRRQKAAGPMRVLDEIPSPV